ncbi:MAG: hypothetical protein AAF223_23850, partial [Bacteroidota bacterium]
MKVAYYLLFAILIACQSATTDEPDESVGDDYGEFTLHKGTNISHWLSQSGRRGAERQAFF